MENGRAGGERLWERNRLAMLRGAGLVGVALLAWAYLFYLARGMPAGETGMEQAMPQMHPWQFSDFTLTFAMWAVMMVGMMLPSASPAILLFTAISQSRRPHETPPFPTATFVVGYLVIWMGFSVAATVGQWSLHLALFAPGLLRAAPRWGGVLLVLAGVFQWTPLKHACLAHCRSPQGFFMMEWQEGAWGAFRMGLRHGAYCLGCCWLLMGLLFLGGTMNLLWAALLALFILLEKVAPAGQWISRVGGALLVGAGIWLAATTLL